MRDRARFGLRVALAALMLLPAFLEGQGDCVSARPRYVSPWVRQPTHVRVLATTREPKTVQTPHESLPTISVTRTYTVVRVEQVLGGDGLVTEGQDVLVAQYEARWDGGFFTCNGGPVGSSLLPAEYSVRRGGWLARAVERACWLGHSLPGVVVALSLVFFGARVVPGLYQTQWMLTLAYVVLFLPQALGAITAALLQISPSMEEASRLLGRGSLTTTVRVVLPLARPGLLAGGALVFLTCMKELPATLLLAPTGYPTLATQVWSSTSEAFFARAALPALALVLLSALPMAILVMHESDRDHDRTPSTRGLFGRLDKASAKPAEPSL